MGEEAGEAEGETNGLENGEDKGEETGEGRGELTGEESGEERGEPSGEMSFEAGGEGGGETGKRNRKELFFLALRDVGRGRCWSERGRGREDLFLNDPSFATSHTATKSLKTTLPLLSRLDSSTNDVSLFSRRSISAITSSFWESYRVSTASISRDIMVSHTANISLLYISIVPSTISVSTFKAVAFLRSRSSLWSLSLDA